MFYTLFELVFIITMSLGALGQKLDTFHYILYSLLVLYIIIIYKEIK